MRARYAPTHQPARARRPPRAGAGAFFPSFRNSSGGKLLHGHDALLGRGWVFDGAAHGSYAVSYPVSPECPWHEPAAEIVTLDDAGSDTPLTAVRDAAALRLGEVTALDLSRELVAALECPRCRRRAEVFAPAEKIAATFRQAFEPCGQAPRFARTGATRGIGQAIRERIAPGISSLGRFKKMCGRVVGRLCQTAAVRRFTETPYIAATEFPKPL